MKILTSLIVALSVTPALAAEKPLTFDQAIATIVARSTAVAGQQATLHSTQASNVPARLYFLPSLSVEARQGRLDIVEPQGSISDSQQLQILSKMNLFRFGADAAAYNATYAAEDQQKALVSGQILSVEDQAIQALVDELSGVLEIEVLKKVSGVQEESLRIARQRYSKSLLSRQEVDKISVDLENARARLIDAQVKEFQAHAALRALLGDSEVETRWPWRERFRGGLGNGLVKAEFRGDERPDAQAAESRVALEDERFKQQQRLILPSLDASLVYGYSAGTYSATTGPITGWTGELLVSLPLFDRLAGISAIRAQSYNRQAADSSLEQVRRNARGEWESSRQGFQAARASAISRDAVLETSRKLYQDNLERFQSGRISANDFAVDQTRLFDSELFAIQGWGTAHLTFSRLCHSFGRRISDCLQ